MTSSTATSTPAPQAARRIGPAAAAVVFWLAVWQGLAWVVGRDFVLASPLAVIVRLAELIITWPLWLTVGTSLTRIAVGFGAAVLIATVTASLAARFRVADVLTAPLIVTMRSVPVVAFIIIVLLWVDATWLAAITAMLIVLPLMHTNLLQGFRHRDEALLEMAQVFEVSWWRRVRVIDVPAVMPYCAAACATGIGLAWKAGVAAEVIGVAHGSIGAELYQAKVFLLSADVLAWTAVIVALSVACQAAVMALLRRSTLHLAGGVS